MATEKRKRISKKNKSAWRKTDIQDVEDYLEEQRQEERIGTFADKKDEDLFHIDIIEAEPHKKQVTLSEREKRKLNAKRPLRSIQIWENVSKVQDPIKKRNIVKQKKSGRNIEKEVCNPTRPRHFQANKDRAKYYEKKEQELTKKATKIPDTNKDIWMEEDFRDKIPGLKDEKGWISKDLSLYIAKNMGKPVIKVHDSVRHKTIKSNRKFMAPPPGTSYNPSFEDHRELITKVVEKEEKIIKEKKHLKRVTTNMFKKVTPEERDEMRLKEMRSGLDNDDDDDNDEAAQNEGILPEEDNDYSTVNPPVKNKKKTKQARNKELKQRDLQQHVTGKKAIKKQIVDINRLKSLKKEVLAEEEKLNELKKKRKKAAFLKKFETKRLGRLKFQEPDEDVKMPEDLVDNLRNVAPESSLLVDRFKSFQKRNILPVSIATGKQKAPKIKRFPRSSHKEPGVSYQILREKRLGKK